jgi:Ca2+-binding EF-hand superfamily protein
MQAWIAKQTSKEIEDDLAVAEPLSPALSGILMPLSPRTTTTRMSVMDARKVKISKKRMSLHDECILSLRQAFQAHIAAFDLEDRGTICVEELIIIFDRCHLFNELFTPNNVRNYFNTWVEGCNQVKGVAGALPEYGIGYEEFRDVLQWAADMTSQGITESAQKVVRMSRKLCDKNASIQKRLEVVFDAYRQQDPIYLSALEFGLLCQKLNIYQQDKFSMGDVYCLFYQINGNAHGAGVDFASFILVIKEIGKHLEIGEEVYTRFANAVELLDTDEETISRLKLRLKQAATVVSGPDWRGFFHSCHGGSGKIDWDEFLSMCRDRLHLAENDNHLRVLFDRLDEDGSGELEIEMLITFISPEI